MNPAFWLWSPDSVRKRETVKEHVKRTLSLDKRGQRRNGNEKEMNPAFWLWSPDSVRKRETVKEHFKRTLSLDKNATCFRSFHVPFVPLAFPCMLCSSLLCLYVVLFIKVS